MKKIIFLLLLFVASASLKVFSQPLKVTSFKQTNDLTASRIEKRDINGNPCGLIKVWLPITDAKFVGNVVETTYKNGEWWVYMTNGSKKITIKSSKHPPLSYEFTEPIQSKVTYTMAIEILKEVDPLYVDGWSIYRNGEKLGDNEIRACFANTESYNLYANGIKKKEAGTLYTWMIILGSGAVGGGVGGFIGESLSSSSQASQNPSYKTEYWLIGGGLAAIGIGWLGLRIQSSTGRNKIQKAVDLYNNRNMRSQNGIELEYGLTGNGVYFSLLF